MEKMKQNENFLKVDTSEIIDKLEIESANDKKKSFTCDLLIQMVCNTGLNKIKIETNKSGKGFNKGSLVECLTRYQILSFLGFNVMEIEKSVNGCDINLSKRNKEMLSKLELKNTQIEIKCLSALSRASRLSDSFNSDFIVLVDIRKKTKGAYIVKVEDLILYQNCTKNDNAYNSIKDYKKGYRLNLLSDLMCLND